MVSPCFTRTSDGLKRMASLMSTVTVRDTLFGSPCRPKECSSVEMALGAGLAVHFGARGQGGRGAGMRSAKAAGEADSSKRFSS